MLACLIGSHSLHTCSFLQTSNFKRVWMPRQISTACLGWHSKSVQIRVETHWKPPILNTFFTSSNFLIIKGRGPVQRRECKEDVPLNVRVLLKVIYYFFSWSKRHYQKYWWAFRWKLFNFLNLILNNLFVCLALHFLRRNLMFEIIRSHNCIT